MTSVQRYAEIKKQIAELETELDVIKSEVETAVFEAEGSKLEIDLGTFKVSYSPKWQYSQELSNQEVLLKDKLKLMKKKEELEGTATKLSDGGRIVFTLKK